MGRTLMAAATLVPLFAMDVPATAQARETPAAAHRAPIRADRDGVPLRLPVCEQGWVSKIFFDRDGSKVPDIHAERILDLAARIATDCRPLRIEVTGYSDSGEAPAISAARARTVRSALIRRGVKRALLKLEDGGVSRPAVATPEVQDRRATMTFRYPRIATGEIVAAADARPARPVAR